MAARKGGDGNERHAAAPLPGVHLDGGGGVDDGAAAAAAAAPQPQPQLPAVISLLDLPDAALILILAAAEDPVPLSCTCWHLANLARSHAFALAFATSGGGGARAGGRGTAGRYWRPPVYRLLTFRPLRGAPPEELAVLALRVAADAAELASGSGSGAAGGAAGGAAAGASASARRLEAARAAQRAGAAPLAVLRALCPFADALLVPYLAMGGHDDLLVEAVRAIWAAQPRRGRGQAPPKMAGLAIDDEVEGGSGSGSGSGEHEDPNDAAGETSDSSTDSDDDADDDARAPPDMPLFCAACPRLGRLDALRLALRAALRGRNWGAAEGLMCMRRGGAYSRGNGAPCGPLQDRLRWLRVPRRAPPASRARGLAGVDEAAALAGAPAQLLYGFSFALFSLAPDAGRRAFILAAAAAGGGSADALAEAEGVTEAFELPGGVRAQLPMALCLAGRAGHFRAVRRLTRSEEVSSRPLELAAQDAARHGWPARALAPVLAAIVVRYREDAARMLALPMETAVERGHRAVADAIWEALVQGRPEPER